MSTFDLDEEKKNILEQFRENVQDVLQQSHDDRFLLRWLRARNYSLKDAEKMLRADFEFRRKMGSDTILETFELRKELQPYECNAFLGFDKYGHPVRFSNMGSCDFKGFTKSTSLHENLKYFTLIFETDLRRLKENNEKNKTCVETCIYISDFTGFKMKQVSDKSVLRYVTQTIKFYQDHYPETLHAVYIINAPNIFYYIFSAIKPFFNEVILNKMNIYGYDGWQEKLFENISKDIIPAYLGGNRYGPDGDPLCKDILNWRPEIPRSLYLTSFHSLKIGDPGVHEKVIRPRSVFEIEEEIEKPGTLLSWEFQTKRCDIRFGLFIREKLKTEEKGKSIKEEIISVDNVNCHDEVEKADILCRKTGTYILLFDNTYSWLTSKHLLYKIELKLPSAQSSTEDFTH